MRGSSAGPTSDILVDLATRFYVAGQSQVEIARALRLDASTVSRYLKRARDEGIVHVEATRHPHRVLQALGSSVVRGVALNPGTPANAVEPLLDDVELILVLAVNPGWSGQRFAPGTEKKLHEVKELVERSGRSVIVGVDGGVTRENAGSIASMGVDLIVAGSAVFDGGDARANLASLQAGVGRRSV